MAEFLDQDAIDRLERELSLAGPKFELAQKAKDKIRLMYYDVTKHPLLNPLDTLTDVCHLIRILSSCIQNDNKYYLSFMLLKNTYIRRGYLPQL